MEALWRKENRLLEGGVTGTAEQIWIKDFGFVA